MNDRTDFERRLTTALAAYAEGAPVEVDAVTLTAAIAPERAHRRWSFPDWAGAIGRPTSPWAALLIVLGLTVALLVGAVAAGAFRSDPVRRLQDGRAIVTETPTPSATPAPSASLPIIDVPADLSPKRTADQVEREVVGMIEANHVGLASVPVTVTKITLMPPGATYVYVDGSSGYPEESLSEVSLYWAVEATGTWVICSSFCDEHPVGAYAIDDATGHIGSSATGPTGRGFVVPSESFRRVLADNGLLFIPAEAPPTGVVPSGAIIERLDPRSFGPDLSIGSPLFGTVVWQNPAMTRGGMDWWPSTGASRAIWWAGSNQISAGGEDQIWAVYDAKAGVLLETNAR